MSTSRPDPATTGPPGGAEADTDAAEAGSDATASAEDQPSAERDIADVPAVEVIATAALHLMSAAAVHLGLAADLAEHTDLDEARTLIDALAGLLTAGAPHLGHHHAAPLRDGLRSLQLAFREASTVPDEPGQGPGEKWTGLVRPVPTRN